MFADEHVRLSDSSKADRGYDLATGRNEDAPQPKHAEEVFLAESATCREALAAMMHRPRSKFSPIALWYWKLTIPRERIS